MRAKHRSWYCPDCLRVIQHDHPEAQSACPRCLVLLKPYPSEPDEFLPVLDRLMRANRGVCVR